MSPRFVPSIRTTCSKFAPSMGNSASVAKTTLSTVGAPVDGLFSLAFRSSTSTISVQDVKANMDAAIIAKYFILHYIQIVENISFFMYICNMLFESKGILTFAS